MEAFQSHRGIVAVLDRANVDTDQIIPKQFLKSVKRIGFGKSLFFDWRYLADGKPNPDFVLNQPRYKNASILVARNNFGCGSSREHAVWAIREYGFRVVIAPYIQRGELRVPGFADIFKNNCGKNGLLAIELEESKVGQIFGEAKKTNQLEASVNLEKQSVIIHGTSQFIFKFEIDQAVKNKLMKGLDDIGLTLQHEKEITQFESNHKDWIAQQK